MLDSQDEETSTERYTRAKSMLETASHTNEFFALFVSGEGNNVLLCTNCPAECAAELRAILLEAANRLTQKYTN